MIGSPGMIIVFVLFSLPIATAFLLFWIHPAAISIRTVRTPIIRAFLWFIPAAIIRTGMHFLPDPSYVPGALFGSIFLRDYFLWTLFGALPAVLSIRRENRDTPANLHLAYISFVGMMLSMAVFLESLLQTGAPGSYELFLRPFLRLSMLLVIPYALTFAESIPRGSWALALLIVLPIPASSVGLLAAWNRPVFAWILGMLVFAGSVIPLCLYAPWRQFPCFRFLDNE